MGATTPSAVWVRNWFGSIVSAPAMVVYPRSVGEIAQILGDPEHYPGSVRAVGSNHSTTPCGVAEGVIVDEWAKDTGPSCWTGHPGGGPSAGLGF